jgi:PiT family inorganic phosphate transporter
MITAVLLLAVGFLAYANGANDNFKGVASLFGSRTLSYRTSLALATATTAAGSVCSLFLASSLLTVFSGSGLVPSQIVESRSFVAAVAGGAGATVMLATLIGAPISTTHALTGSLVGAGALAAWSDLNLGLLHRQFILPLLLSPLVSSALAVTLFFLLRPLRERMAAPGRSCVCVGRVQDFVALPERGAALRAQAITPVALTFDSENACAERFADRFLAFDTRRLIDTAHIFSAGMVGFARGMNDTPKIAALLLGAAVMNPIASTTLVACAIAIGGVLSARRVAETMSDRITPLDHDRGLAANAATSVLVIAASTFGLPVSTTHVSVGAISGIGIVTHEGHGGVMLGILGAWVLTLPCAAVSSATVYWALS